LGAGLANSIAGSVQPNQKGAMELTSTAFSQGMSIPPKYTCDGQNVSPPLIWSGVPTGAKSLVLIVDDPDAPVGTWAHWVLYNVAASATELSEQAGTPPEALQGINDFKRPGYGGPCPPPGKSHRYFFKLYALDTVLGLKAGAKKQEVERAMEKHILAQAQLLGTYQRK